MTANDPIAELVSLLSRLPGIGERTATRLAYHVLEGDAELASSLGEALATIHSRVQRCRICGNYALQDTCNICADPRRDPKLVCAVARPPDVAAIERAASFSGRYHVLHRLLSPLDGVGPDALPVQPLLDRVENEGIEEIIVATPLNVEGEATALYLTQMLRPLGVRCSRIASGMPHGGELEYTDQVTLTRAFEDRKAL